MFCHCIFSLNFLLITNSCIRLPEMNVKLVSLQLLRIRQGVSLLSSPLTTGTNLSFFKNSAVSQVLQFVLNQLSSLLVTDGQLQLAIPTLEIPSSDWSVRNITQAFVAQTFPLFLNYIQICEVKEISSTFRENLNDLSTSRCEQSSWTFYGYNTDTLVKFSIC